MRAQLEMCRTIRILESLNTESGEKEKDIIEAIQKRIYKGINITITKSGGINRSQLLKNIVDRMRQRLFNDLKNKSIIQDLKVRNIEKCNLIIITQTSKLHFFSPCRLLEKYLK
jgi:phosphoribosyl-dephospho-CoA transferase